MQFEPLELHVVNALGQQDVPDYLQQPTKAITEEVSVMRGPQAEEWIQAVREGLSHSRNLVCMNECQWRMRHRLHCPRDFSW